MCSGAQPSCYIMTVTHVTPPATIPATHHSSASGLTPEILFLVQITNNTFARLSNNIPPLTILIHVVGL